MRFRTFLESSDFLSWDQSNPQWVPAGGRATFQVHITPNRISIDFASPQHPLLKRAITMLVRQRPDVFGKKIDFDGYSPGTVEEYLNNQAFHGKKDILPSQLFTGTSLYRWEKIKEEGLVPRVISGQSPVYGAQTSSALPSNPNYIYLSNTYGATVRFAASEASRDDSEPVILKINTKNLDPNKLRPDEDSKTSNWQSSLYELGTVAYEGIIKPSDIEIYKAYNTKTKTWDDPGKWLEPQDWLAQQIINKKSGWIKPR